MSIRIPHYEKIVIGPFTILCEMVLGGHYIETLKIKKQSSNASYPRIVTDIWKQYKMKGFYIGFWPWSAFQITKGLPVLFVQAETKNMMDTYTSLSSSQSQLLSGVLGGMSQGVFVTPTQRLKTIIMTRKMTTSSQTSLQLVKEFYKKEGLRTFFKGLTPMIIRRGFDWGIRFYCFHYIQNKILEHRRKKKPTYQLRLLDTMMSGFGAGFLATATTPIDTCIAESQKYTKKSNRKSLFQIIRHIHGTYGYRGFMRGWCVRVLHSCYHTLWVCGVGSAIFSRLR